MSGAHVPPRFSVVIPCFNQGAFLAECLESLRAQTLPPHEVIVVDDGSTDPYSVRRMDELCVGRVKLVRQENRGLSGARNSGIRAATGDWIVPLDADDCLTPDALLTYARAITNVPEVDVWYPDMQHFGQDTTLWECPPFNAWRLLKENHLLCSSAIRRAVFDAGVRYNENMRQGYEDWEFYIHACVERGFLARPLERPVFRYRKWGYSMVSASDAKRATLLEQLRRERPVYQDAERLMELKALHQPYLAIASESEALKPALEGQRLRDFQLVDTSGQVTREGGLAAFQGYRFSRLLVSVEDAPLAAALRADPFLLEKVARVLQEQRPAVLWLVTTGPEKAWPGFLLTPDAARASDVRCVGFALDPARLLGAAPLPRTGAGLLEDVARHLEGLAPGSRAFMGVGARAVAGPAPGARDSATVGAHGEARDGLPLPQAALSAPVPTTSAPTGRGAELRQGLKLVGQGASRVLRGVLGAERHERLRSLSAARQLRSRLGNGLRRVAASTAPAAPARQDADAQREGPFTAWQLDSRRQREELARCFGQPPLYDERPMPGEPALLILTSSLTEGAGARPLVELLKGLHAAAPSRRHYLVTTDGLAARAWADAVLPTVRGAFSASDLAPHAPQEFIASLAKVLGVGAVLLAHSRAALEALPALRQLEPRPRVISLADTPPPRDAEAGTYTGPSAEAAARFNNLIDGYAVSHQETADLFVQRLYVSPTKLRLVAPGADPSRHAREVLELLFPDSLPQPQRRMAP